jgi:hypothetical protein
MDLFERLAAARPTSVEEKQPPKDPAQTLLTWLQKWGKSVVSLRDIQLFGPSIVRNQRSAIDAAETLVKTNWLVPDKAHRRDRRVWQVIRPQTPTVHPTVKL